MQALGPSSGLRAVRGQASGRPLDAVQERGSRSHGALQGHGGRFRGCCTNARYCRRGGLVVRDARQLLPEHVEVVGDGRLHFVTGPIIVGPGPCPRAGKVGGGLGGGEIGLPASRAAASQAAFAFSTCASASSAVFPKAEHASRSGMSAIYHHVREDPRARFGDQEGVANLGTRSVRNTSPDGAV